LQNATAARSSADDLARNQRVHVVDVNDEPDEKLVEQRAARATGLALGGGGWYR
jgi:hypothetical protein